MSRSALDTPMMQQFLAIKAQQPDAILLYRMGDFYEMFLRDAEIAAPLLDIALTTRDRGKEDAVPMCGIPVHSADPYIKKLAELGHRVAICEQVEDPRDTGGKRLVKRAVVEVITPGLVGDPEGIEAAAELTLAALDPGGEVAGLAVLDASTGDFRATEALRIDPSGEAGITLPRLLTDELQRVAPREILFPAPAGEALQRQLASVVPGAALTGVDASTYELSLVRALDGGAADALGHGAARAAGAVLAYLKSNQPSAFFNLKRLRAYRLTDSMVLDSATRDHLELFRNSEDGTRKGTLLDRIDCSSTALGARRLARWLAYPLLDPGAIAARQDAVLQLAGRDRHRARLREALRPVRDLERLLAKAMRPTSTPRDYAALRASLEALPDVTRAIGAAGTSDQGPLFTGDSRSQANAAGASAALPVVVPTPGIASLLREGLIDDPPSLPRGSRGAHESGYIRSGYHAELDRLRESGAKGREIIAGLEARERERSGISTLKVRFHPVHGYSFEVTKSNLGRVPDDYERKQTLASAERFTTPELREVEGDVLLGNERAALLERELFDALRESLAQCAGEIRAAADGVAEVDAITSLAETARLCGWVRPRVDDSLILEIHSGRHPVVESLLLGSGGEFVPNDTRLDPADTQLVVLTGPNMSGKSTYLRQVALIVLLAQMGSFVPAASARVGIVDRVFTRVGASDRLARGESTFMVEMRETAEILASASRRSLVILDEIGRGTSTYDGVSIAWAVAEYLHDAPGLSPRTLFATHYHELSDLARTLGRVRNAHFEAREWGDEVIFMRQLVPGGANRSFGIQVARLAGLPGSIIDRAREILHNLEGGEFDARGRPRLAERAQARPPAEPIERGQAPLSSDPPNAQLALFVPPTNPPEEEEVLEILRSLDPDRTTPLEALHTLAQLVSRLRGGAG